MSFAQVFKRSFCLMLSAGTLFMLSACSSAAESRENEEYYEVLSEYTDTLLMQNRELTEIIEDWSYKDKDSTKKYINKLGEIEETTAGIRSINASESFSDFDKTEVEDNCDLILESTALIKAMVQSAYDSGDDSDYKRNNEETKAAYDEAYDAVIASAAELRARIR